MLENLGTVESFARELGLQDILSRAISFDPRLEKTKQIPVAFNWNLKSCAGRGSTSKIHLHPGLRDQGKIALISTFLHEVAHAMEGLIYGGWKYGHGYNWFEQMIRLGQVPERTHNYAACRQRKADATEIEI
jgi:hypothetical protein